MMRDVCARVVFDGYDAASTMDAEHSRRVASSREVIIEDNLRVSMLQHEFFGNTANKYASLPYSHRIWKMLVVRCITGSRMLIC